MKGIKPSTLRPGLAAVDPEHAQNPERTVQNVDEKLGEWKEKIERYGDFNFWDKYYQLPLKVFAGFSFEDLCKFRVGSPLMMTESVRRFFERSLSYSVVEKIISSMWRWGHRHGDWNDVVNAYGSLQRFDLGYPGFEARIDHATYQNECGYSRFTRTYLDGAFGILVYRQGVHVLTIGFSILDRRRLVLQQVQSAQRAGNRHLFRLPKNRIEFAIDVLRRNFPKWELFLIDGDALVRKILANYQGSLENERERAKSHKEHLEGGRIKPDQVPDARTRYDECLARCRVLEEQIRHLRSDRRRIAAIYRDVGRYSLSGKLETLGMLHRGVCLPAPRRGGRRLLSAMAAS